MSRDEKPNTVLINNPSVQNRLMDYFMLYNFFVDSRSFNLVLMTTVS
ncbi:hypothetical protein SAMN04488130_102279 [Flavobacterium urumqiense]|uniref:Uncharacterized protein n=1 Tax=Flavobacterium urumqiense TaxID=935224 RepID=A0A1H5UIG3_9FLAO|nr:hypothetical protein SAMN04488130_102279 [Flavobacterium urumqiense]